MNKRFQLLAAVDFPGLHRTKGNWYDAAPPLCRDRGGLCPADHFGRTMIANLPADIRVGIVNVSVAGCRIELFDKDWPAQVKGVYDNLIQDLDLKAEAVPRLAGELVNADQQGACASMNAIIAELPKVLPNSHVIFSKVCACRPDHLHFNPAGYRKLGRRYAVQMLSLLGYRIAESE